MQTSPSLAANSLNVDQVSLWRGDRCLFKELSFELGAGELIHLTGPNGSGKTSLLRVICGLTLPEDGAVYWCGNDTRKFRTEFNADVCYAGHKEGLKDELNAGQNLQTHLAMRGLRYDPDILNHVGLEHVKEVPVGRLSAGQRRRVVLARVLASQATLWILDEPFSNLDDAGRQLFRERIEGHVQDGGSVIVTAHHELRFDAIESRNLGLGQ